jgi:hypothetical protein
MSPGGQRPPGHQGEPGRREGFPAGDHRQGRETLRRPEGVQGHPLRASADTMGRGGDHRQGTHQKSDYSATTAPFFPEIGQSFQIQETLIYNASGAFQNFPEPGFSRLRIKRSWVRIPPGSLPRIPYKSRVRGFLFVREIWQTLAEKRLFSDYCRRPSPEPPGHPPRIDPEGQQITLRAGRIRETLRRF